MSDYYFPLLEITTKYLGSMSPTFVHRVLGFLKISSTNLDEKGIRKFAEEIDNAVGSVLSNEKKEQFKREVLDLLK